MEEKQDGVGGLPKPGSEAAQLPRTARRHCAEALGAMGREVKQRKGGEKGLEVGSGGLNEIRNTETGL